MPPTPRDVGIETPPCVTSGCVPPNALPSGSRVLGHRSGRKGVSEDGTRMQERRSSFEYEHLLAWGRGELFKEGPQLPMPPMLMFDRISEIAEQGGEHGKGMA